jgi:hypothetical protein
MNGTPKKNGTGNGKGISNLVENQGVSSPIPNLRLEAKMAAEVSYFDTMSSRIFFCSLCLFSLWA